MKQSKDWVIIMIVCVIWMEVSTKHAINCKNDKSLFKEMDWMLNKCLPIVGNFSIINPPKWAKLEMELV